MCPAVAESTGAVCESECYADKECPNLQKCCKNARGGFVCTVPGKLDDDLKIFEWTKKIYCPAIDTSIHQVVRIHVTHLHIFVECDTSKEGFSQKTPVAMLNNNGKCPSGSRTQSFINSQRLCCQYDWSMSSEPGTAITTGTFTGISYEYKTWSYTCEMA